MRAGAYKSPPAAAYGCEKEEAGGLNLSAVPVQQNLPPGTVQASGPSWEGSILAMHTQERRLCRLPVRCVGRGSRTGTPPSSKGRGDRGGKRC
jgi:hypothetical protein